ncbi:immunoglobulin-like domain-containing protein [Enterococcus quebecensis]|uniref:Pesticidal crystal protein Cry22Aa Ig-like domain-containing protein n=1 Tax=Enterococcus quebecensis TaxID=903983 RepID=A0A1E5GUY3_9ENTE|nr:immunoglobulin-like domain-containing protein [Enterococcus quebecensis]OEG16485.1 hypothetical protein BCR23_06240 [Enterococcus quebecensis]
MKKICEYVIVSSILAGVVFSSDLTSELPEIEANAQSKTTVQLEFIGVNDITIPLGNQFNPLKGVSLVSNNGKVSSDTQISVSSDRVNVHKEGTYTQTYVAFDDHGRYVLKDRRITVKALTDNKPEINATARVILKGTSFKPLKHAKAWDKEDGDISKNIKVSGSVNTLVSGIYSINYSVTDSSGNTKSKTVQFYVI